MSELLGGCYLASQVEARTLPNPNETHERTFWPQMPAALRLVS
jgi:hypothetical protein